MILLHVSILTQPVRGACPGGNAGELSMDHSASIVVRYNPDGSSEALDDGSSICVGDVFRVGCVSSVLVTLNKGGDQILEPGTVAMVDDKEGYSFLRLTHGSMTYLAEVGTMACWGDFCVKDSAGFIKGSIYSDLWGSNACISEGSPPDYNVDKIVIGVSPYNVSGFGRGYAKVFKTTPDNENTFLEEIKSGNVLLVEGEDISGVPVEDDWFLSMEAERLEFQRFYSWNKDGLQWLKPFQYSSTAYFVSGADINSIRLSSLLYGNAQSDEFLSERFGVRLLYRDIASIFRDKMSLGGLVVGDVSTPCLVDVDRYGGVCHIGGGLLLASPKRRYNYLSIAGVFVWTPQVEWDTGIEPLFVYNRELAVRVGMNFEKQVQRFFNGFSPIHVGVDSNVVLGGQYTDLSTGTHLVFYPISGLPLLGFRSSVSVGQVMIGQDLDLIVQNIIKTSIQWGVQWSF